MFYTVNSMFIFTCSLVGAGTLYSKSGKESQAWTWYRTCKTEGRAKTACTTQGRKW